MFDFIRHRKRRDFEKFEWIVFPRDLDNHCSVKSDSKNAYNNIKSKYADSIRIYYHKVHFFWFRARKPSYVDIHINTLNPSVTIAMRLRTSATFGYASAYGKSNNNQNAELVRRKADKRVLILGVLAKSDVSKYNNTVEVTQAGKIVQSYSISKRSTIYYFHENTPDLFEQHTKFGTVSPYRPLKLMARELNELNA